MTMYLRRRAAFSAGYLNSPEGKPGGHNYICELCVSGDIDPVTGMVVNITDVDAVLKTEVVHKLDGKLFDRDIPGLVATTEKLAQFVWDACVDKLPKLCRLSSLTLYSKPTEWVTTTAGLDKTMFTVTRAYEFSASHRLHAPSLSEAENKSLFGKCNWPNGHGHNYEVEVTVTGDVDPSTGRVVDLDVVDNMVEQEILLPFDHKHLNLDVPEFADSNPTSENLTKVIWDRLSARWQRDGVVDGRLYRVAVRETPRNFFEYFGPTH